jgi:trk system potassium uptake protein TrkA
MHIIVIGCGKVGSKLAQVLSSEGHDVVLVDNDSNAFKILPHGFNGITITGVPIDQDVLKHAGIETADALAAVTHDDNINIMVCQVATEIFKVPCVIARIYNPEREHVFHQFGLETICPTDISVGVIRSKILDKVGFHAHNIGNSEVLFKYEEISSSYESKKISSIKLNDNEFLFGILRNGGLMFANPSITFNKNDILVIASKN